IGEPKGSKLFWDLGVHTPILRPNHAAQPYGTVLRPNPTAQSYGTAERGGARMRWVIAAGLQTAARRESWTSRAADPGISRVYVRHDRWIPSVCGSPAPWYVA